MNKTLLKLTGLLFCFGITDAIVILYWWIRYEQTHSSFYFSAFEFGGIFFSLGIPALVLLGLSLIILGFSKWYKGNVSATVKSLIIILAAIIFLAPYTPYLLPSDHPKTYRGFQELMEQRRIEREKKEEKQCVEYKQKMSEWREGQPILTPPSGCN